MKSKSTRRGQEKRHFSAYLPEQLIRRLDGIAVREHRSRNEQILSFLSSAVSHWETEHPKEDEVAA
jgi:metal-responsive CopG/Arc/MetJ family transcriptional regulator